MFNTAQIVAATTMFSTSHEKFSSLSRASLPNDQSDILSHKLQQNMDFAAPINNDSVSNNWNFSWTEEPIGLWSDDIRINNFPLEHLATAHDTTDYLYSYFFFLKKIVK